MAEALSGNGKVDFLIIPSLGFGALTAYAVSVGNYVVTGIFLAVILIAILYHLLLRIRVDNHLISYRSALSHHEFDVSSVEDVAVVAWSGVFKAVEPRVLAVTYRTGSARTSFKFPLYAFEVNIRRHLLDILPWRG